MSRVPDGWTNSQLSNLATLQRGFDLPVQQRRNGEIPIYASNGVVGVHSESKVVGPGVVTGRSGTIGKVHFVDQDFWPLNTTLYVKDFHGNHPQFVAQFLDSFDLLSLASGTGVPTLNRNDVHVSKIVIPPLPEQKKIAAILSSVDEAIAATQAVIEQTRKVKQGLLQDLLTRGIGHTRFKQTEIGEIPEEWEVKTIGAVATFQGGSQPPRESFIFEYKEGYVRLIQIRDYKTDKYKTYIPKDATKKFCSEENIMIGRYGPPIFQILRGLEGAYNVALIKAIPKSCIMNEFLYYVLKQRDLFYLMDRLSQRSSGQTGVDMDALRSFPVALPLKEEQKAIVDVLAGLDSYSDAVSEKHSSLLQIKRGLMQDLLSGSVRVTTP